MSSALSSGFPLSLLHSKAIYTLTSQVRKQKLAEAELGLGHLNGNEEEIGNPSHLVTLRD